MARPTVESQVIWIVRTPGTTLRPKLVHKLNGLIAMADPVPTGKQSTYPQTALGIWLMITLFLSLFVAPADPVSYWMSWVFGLICFGTGMLSGSSIYSHLGVGRVLVGATLGTVIAMNRFVFPSIPISVLYMVASIFLGYQASPIAQRTN